MNTDTVKVVGLRTQNVQRIEIVELAFTPEGGLETISGTNGSGKTTLLNSIAAAVGGAKFALDVRIGCEKATSEVTLSNGMTVLWTVYDDGRRTLTVKDPNNMRGTQATLDAFISKFALNVPAFINASEKDRLGVLLSALNIDPEPFRKRIKDAEETRTVIGREEARMRGELASLTAIGEPVTELQSETEVLRQLQDLEKITELRRQADATVRAAAQKVSEWKSYVSQKCVTISDYDQQIADLQSKIANLEQMKQTAIAQHDEAVSNDMPKAESALREAEVAADAIIVPSSSALMAQLDSIRSNNARFEQQKAIREKQAAYEAKLAEYKDAGTKVDLARNELKALTSGDRLGIPGLTVDEASLVYNGVPFGKLSDAEKLTLSAKIVRLENPLCGFMLVDGLEQMDSKTRQAFAAWLKENDIQCIGTLVSDEGPAGSIVIENGRVLIDKRDEAMAK